MPDPRMPREANVVYQVYVALGSNVGDREAHLAAARELIDAIPGTHVVAATAAEETAPFGPVPQGPFLNQMVAVRTTLPPRGLLAALQRIEQLRGRVRRERWGPRTLDLDIVAIEGGEVRDPDLQVPHAGLPDRDFWQRQLAELRAASSSSAEAP